MTKFCRSGRWRQLARIEWLDRKCVAGINKLGDVTFCEEMKTLIFKVNQLGDNVVSLPLIQFIVDRLGSDQTHVFTTPTAAALYDGLIPEKNRHTFIREDFNGIWKSPSGFFELCRLVRHLKPQLVLVPFDQGNVARMVARLSGARWRVGVLNPATKTNWCLNHLFETDLGRAMAEQDWALARILQEIPEISLSDVPEFPPAPDLSRLVESENTPAQRRILIHPGASRAYKQWTLAHFEKLAEQLVKRGFEVVWISQTAAEEKRLPTCVMQKKPSDLKSFINDLASARLFVGNNSGPMNLANALGIPSVIVSGPSPEKWDPYWYRERVANLRVPGLRCQPCDPVSGPINFCENRDTPMACMKGISVELVIQEIERLLENQSR